jgi:polyferredoxin
MDGQKTRLVRTIVQLWFLAFTVFIGYRFYQFVRHFEDPSLPFVERPSSVDAFLPISGFMSLKLFLFTGIVEPVHPASLVLFLAAIAVSVGLKKGFCGWICPVGTVSEYAWKLGGKVAGRNAAMNEWVDGALQFVKYLLLLLIIFLIGIAMLPTMAALFIMSDYYKVIDVRMLRFFTHPSTVTVVVVGSLVALSFVFKNVWCRYLCPYGALLGILSYLSPLRIRRNEEKCIHCHACSSHCPGQIDVEGETKVSSHECFGCMTCVSRCPAEGALELSYKWEKKARPVGAMGYALALLVVFYAVVAVGMATGNWKSKMPVEEYQRLIPPISQDAAAR